MISCTFNEVFDAKLEEVEIVPIRRFCSYEAPEKAPKNLLKMHSIGTPPVINQLMVGSSEIAVNKHTTKENEGGIKVSQKNLPLVMNTTTFVRSAKLEEN